MTGLQWTSCLFEKIRIIPRAKRTPLLLLGGVVVVLLVRAHDRELVAARVPLGGAHEVRPLLEDLALVVVALGRIPDVEACGEELGHADYERREWVDQ